MYAFRSLKRIFPPLFFILIVIAFPNTKIVETFACDKDAGVCEYRTNTFINRSLYVEKQINIKNIDKVGYKHYQTQTVRKGKTKIKDYHTMTIMLKDDVYTFPMDFRSMDEAMVEVNKMNEYLSNNERYYVYDNSRNPHFMLAFFLLSVLGAIYFSRRAIAKEKRDKEMRLMELNKK